MSEHNEMDARLSHSLLICLRSIIRATEKYSRELAKRHGLTGPQLLLLKELSLTGMTSSGKLAELARLSGPTVTHILDRLEEKGLVIRSRSEKDKRIVLVRISEKGEARLASSPSLLQEHFVHEFTKLEKWEMQYIVAALQRVAHMMGASTEESAPVLTPGPLNATEHAISEFHDGSKDVQD